MCSYVCSMLLFLFSVQLVLSQRKLYQCKVASWSQLSWVKSEAESPDCTVVYSQCYSTYIDSESPASQSLHHQKCWLISSKHFWHSIFIGAYFLRTTGRDWLGIFQTAIKNLRHKGPDVLKGDRANTITRQCATYCTVCSCYWCCNELFPPPFKTS